MAQKETKINIDYIGVVKEDDGKYTYERVEIKKSEELITTLKAMLSNPNRTLLDLQDYFTAHLGKNPKTSYNCCLPYEYGSSYIDYVHLPNIMPVKMYQDNRQEIVNNLKNEYDIHANSEKVVFCVSNEQMEYSINDRIKRWDNDLKDKFLTEAIRYINAVDFTVTTDNIKKNSRYRMLSHEHIGWTTLTHKINDDLTITVKTNFGYGSSAYFMVNVCYKGIDLLPYSLLVKYYYAGIEEIKRCTRSYQSDRKNWELAMDFIADVSNQTRMGEATFVKNWLKYEIDEMITRLYAINANPMDVLNDVKDRSVDRLGLRAVTAVSDSELERLKLYPDEMSFVFKVSKLTTALDLIEKLQLLGDIYKPALEAIANIEDINRLLTPEIEERITLINTKVTDLENTLNPIKEQYKLMCDSEEEHRTAIRDLYEIRKSDNISWKQVNNMYYMEHPELTKLEKEKQMIESKIHDIESRISNYKKFNHTISKCHNRIKQAGLLCA